MIQALAVKAHTYLILADGGVPQPSRNAPPKLTDKVNTVLGLLAWVGTAAGVAGVLITGAMMAVSMRRGEGSEHMGRLGMVLGGCVLVATAGPVVQFVFT
ncbi:hypothetical protein GCM10010260_67610 [Streptomyces filipinensis]|uniref:Uncharacterized protein n=1 Tax=Streptomyces filipinensis TaxID=66887 RepID=A0A918MEV2_9ACTN|nr:hypothetical protein [Streptomyces filipinensis]GGV18299.1 hypothetical protein GCM10010260_67610 [Streptomyces filipinensis]